ncbi:hypothetical protein A0H81_03723 [Grifola frondosa]|uniref:Uncharacterized protein n=1 Tax=Grifola frondosa TaxID=5627 RepID=A0A1C7MNS9_GRIFR|nr:hypothetical protein A0H81_03723 [Grifola frondosa]
MNVVELKQNGVADLRFENERSRVTRVAPRGRVFSRARKYFFLSKLLNSVAQPTKMSQDSDETSAEAKPLLVSTHPLKLMVLSAPALSLLSLAYVWHLHGFPYDGSRLFKIWTRLWKAVSTDHNSRLATAYCMIHEQAAI